MLESHIDRGPLSGRDAKYGEHRHQNRSQPLHHGNCKFFFDSASAADGSPGSAVWGLIIMLDRANSS